jgi:protein required for attachment to host cells
MKIDHGMMVVALDGRKMVILRNEGDARYPALEVISHCEADNPRTAEQGTDRPGRTFSSVGPRRSALDEPDIHDNRERDFVSSAAKSVGRYGLSSDVKYVVLADPATLGRFRKCCEPAIAKRIVAELPRNMVHRSAEEIARKLAAIEI